MGMNAALKAAGRHVCTADGKAVFLLCDTAWELLHRMTAEETAFYLDVRARQGFNAFFTVILAEHNGLTCPNAYGKLPLRVQDGGGFDPCDWEDGEGSYWAHTERVLQLAADRGMYVGLLPCWGDKFHLGEGAGPEIFTVENARAYGKKLAERYGHHRHVFWILGGDRDVSKPEHRAVIRAFAAGIKAVQTQQMIGFHPPGTKSSSAYFPDEDWLDFHMLQSGHGRDGLDNAAMVRQDYERYRIPVLDGEPRYEDHPIDFNPQEGFWTGDDACRAGYEAVFSGAFGHVYGHNSVWCVRREKNDYYRHTWQEALTRPGAERIGHLRRLMEACDFSTLAPVRHGKGYWVLGRADLTLVYIEAGAVFTPLLEECRQAVYRRFDPADGELTEAVPADGRAFCAGGRDMVLQIVRGTVREP